LVDIFGNELSRNVQNFMQKDLIIEVKIFQKVLGIYFFETPCMNYAKIHKETVSSKHIFETQCTKYKKRRLQQRPVTRIDMCILTL